MIYKLNNQNFESWIQFIVESKKRKRYLLYDFENEIINLVKDFYSKNETTFLNSKYYLWCFEESDTFYNPDILKIGTIGYSDLVTARTEGKDFIVLIPKMSANQLDFLPSDSSKGTSESIEKSVNRFAEYILEFTFKTQLLEIEFTVLKEMQNLLIQKFPNDLFHFFTKDTNNKDDIFKFYGILNSYDNLFTGKNGKPIRSIFESRYRILFIEKIKDILINYSISWLEEKLKVKNVSNFELVIKEFWLEPYDLARDLGNQIDLVFFRKTEYYSSLINVDEWIKALNDEDEIESKSQIEYSNKKELDRYSVIYNNNSFISDFNNDGSIYIPNLEKTDFIELYLSNQENADWSIENEIINENDSSLNIFLNDRVNILTPISAKKNEDKRSIFLALYPSEKVSEFNNDFAFSLRNDKGKLIPLKKSSSDIFGDENRLQEIHNELKVLAFTSSENLFDPDDFKLLEEAVFFRFKKKKNELEFNSNLQLNFRFLSSANDSKFIAFCNQDLTDLRINYKNFNEFNYQSKQHGTFTDKTIIIDEISDGYLFFTLLIGSKKILISIEIVTEALLQHDLIVGNSFLKLKALNDSSNKRKKITIASKGNNEIHQYYFGEKFNEELTYLPTIFNDFKSNMVEIDLSQSMNCPVIGKELLKVPATEFRPNKSFFEDFSSTNQEMKLYISNRNKIKTELVKSLNNSFDSLDFSKLSNDLKSLIDNQLNIYNKINDESNIIGQFIDTYYIVENDENNILNDVPLALFLSPLHPFLLVQLISKSEILNNTLNAFGTKKTSFHIPTINSISQSLNLNILTHWVIKSTKTDESIIFHQLNTDSLLFTGYINSSFGFKPNNLSGILRHLDVNCNESDGFLSYSQIQSALSKSFDYLSKKPEFNICLKGELADKDTNKAIFEWIERTQKQLKDEIDNFEILVNIYDCRNPFVDPYPESNEISYFKNDLNLNFNWFRIDDPNELEIDITIVTSQKSNKSLLNQRNHDLLSHNFYYRDLVAFRLNKKNDKSLLSDVIYQNNLSDSQTNLILNNMNDSFSNILNGKNRQVQHNLIGASFNNTQLLAISSQISSSQILQEINSGKSLWEFSISDYSFQDSGRGDYYLLADEQKDYVDRFFQFLREINENVTNELFQKFIHYSKEIGLFQLRNLLSNSNFLKEFIACVTARKLIDCKIKDKNIFVVPYDLFQPRLRKIKDELNPKYIIEGTQFPDFILVEYCIDDLNNCIIDLRLIEVKYREKDLTKNEIGTILKDQTERIKEIFHNLNEFRETFDNGNMWKHTLSILFSEMYSYYLDNNDLWNNNDSRIFNDIINSEYKLRINESLLIAIDGASKFEFGEIDEGIYYKIPRSSIHEVFECSSSLNLEFGKMFDSMQRMDTSDRFSKYEEQSIEQGKIENQNENFIGDIYPQNSDYSEPNPHLSDAIKIDIQSKDLDNSDLLNDINENTLMNHVILGKDRKNKVAIFYPKGRPGSSPLPNYNVMVTGSSGKGKTQFIKSFIYQQKLTGTSFTIIDFKNDYSDIFFSTLCQSKKIEVKFDGIPYNPLIPRLGIRDDGSKYYDVSEHINAICAVLANTFGLGIQQEAELKNAVRAVYKENGINHKGILEFDSEIIFPSFNEVGYYLENGEKELEKLYNRLDPLFDLNLFSEKYRNIGFSNIIESSNIIKLSDIQDDKIKNAIAKMVIVSAHGYYLGIPHTYSLKKIFVFDEAHRVLDTDFVEKFIRECRSFGVGVLLSSQQTDDFPENVLGQLATKIIHGNDGDSRLTKKIKSLISYDGDDNSINNLQTFNAIVSSQDYNNWLIDTLAWPQLIILKIISDSTNGISLDEIIEQSKKIGISKGWDEFIKLLLEKDYIEHHNSSYTIKI